MNLDMQLRFDGLLVQAMLGATVLFICAAVGVIVLGARSAALRHRMWTLSMIAALSFPGFAVLMPTFGPQWSTVLTAQTDQPTKDDVSTLAETSGRLAPQSSMSFQPLRSAADSADSEPAPVIERMMSRASIATDRASVSNTSQVERSSDSSGKQREQFALGVVLITLWLAGLIIGLFVLVNSQRSAAGLVRRSIPVTNRHTLELAEQLRASAGVRVAVPILVSSEVTVPVTFGCLCPVIVLPSGYGQWTTERCCAVLSHELAHIRRRDVLSQQVAQLASVIYWCQPLVWFANWRMRVEREFACDDAVLQMGESPQEYAGHLLELASVLCGHSHPPKCVVAIASKGGLECRIKSILHSSLNRRPVGASTGWMLAGTAFAIVVVSCLLSPSASKNADLGQRAIAAAGDEPTDLLSRPPDATRENSLSHTAVVTSAADNSAGHGGRQLVLQFPPDHAIGVIYIQDYDQDIRQTPIRWADARGSVRVPSGKKIRLDIGAAGRHDLSPLRQLSPRSLDMLSVREADVDDAALASIGHLTGLKSIRLYRCGIEETGIRHLAQLSELEVLDFSGSAIGDASLAQLESLEKLLELNLGYTATITDRGMHHIAKLKSLRTLNLARTQVTDSGLARLKDLVSLRSLNLGSVRFISDSGMASLSNLTNLRDLDLSAYMRYAKHPIGDQGLARLVNLRELRRLDISGTAPTEAGLAYLQSFSKLEELRLPSGPSDAGLKRIGTLISLRKLGVSISMASDRGLSHLSHLENLEFLNLWCDGSRVTDRAVAYLRPMKRLKTLGLNGSAMTDNGLRALAQLKSLEDLRLHGNGITFEGLRHLHAFESLRALSFSGLKGRRGTLRHLKLVPQLRSLGIGKNPQLDVDGVGTDATDEGLAYLSGMTDLERLSLSSITVTDEGIKHISGFKSLKMLHLANNQNSFTDSGLAYLADLKKLESLFLRGSITDRGLVHLSGLESLQTSSVQGRPWGTISNAAMEQLSESLPSMNKVYNFWRPRT